MMISAVSISNLAIKNVDSQYKHVYTINYKKTYLIQLSMYGASTTLSNESQTFNDYRYQKALKQISKLININRQIKIESDQFQDENQQLCEKYNEMVEINSNMEAEIYTLREGHIELNEKHRLLEEYCQKIQQQTKKIGHQKQSQAQTLKKHVELQKQEMQIHELQMKIHEMERQHLRVKEENNAEMSQLTAKLQELHSLQDENNRLQQEYGKVIIENQEKQQKIQEMNSHMMNLRVSTASGRPDEALLQKLKISEEWIGSLNEQVTRLKQNILEIECGKRRNTLNVNVSSLNPNLNSQQSLSSAKVLESYSNTQRIDSQNDLFAMYNTMSNNYQASNIAAEYVLKGYIRKIQKKMKKIQDERLKFEDKYKKSKNRSAFLESKTDEQSKKIEWLNTKIKGYERLTQRQQSEIEHMLKEYSQQSQNYKMRLKLIQQQKRSLEEQLKKKPQSIQQMQLPEQSLQLINRSPLLAPPSEQSLIRKQNEFKQTINSLESDLFQALQQKSQRQKFVLYLQQKIKALNQEQVQIVKENDLLQQELSRFKTADLCKTSKIYKKNDQNLLKTQLLERSAGGKVFVINGKKYETKLLGHQNSSQNSTQGRNGQKISQQLVLVGCQGGQSQIFYDRGFSQFNNSRNPNSSITYNKTHMTVNRYSNQQQQQQQHKQLQQHPQTQQFNQYRGQQLQSVSKAPVSSNLNVSLPPNIPQLPIRNQSSMQINAEKYPQLARNVIFHSGEISYSTSHRSYENNSPTRLGNNKSSNTSKIN